MGRKETDHSVPSFSMPEDDFKEFEEFWADKYGSRQSAIRAAIKLLMTDNLRNDIPEQAGNIEMFGTHMKKLNDLYRAALDWSITATERAKSEVAGQLEGMATLAKTNERLEAEKAELLKKNAELEREVSDLRQDVGNLNMALNDVSAGADDAEFYRKRCAELTQEKADLIAKHNAEIAVLQNENFAKILEVVKASAK